MHNGRNRGNGKKLRLFPADTANVVHNLYWRKTDKAPRAVCLALFWESSYGQQTIDCTLFNAMQTHKMLSESLGRKVQNLEARIRYLEKNGTFDSANAPFLTPVETPINAFS